MTKRGLAGLGLLGLGLLGALALVVRIAFIDAQSLWVDEALTLVVAGYAPADLFFHAVDPTPGLYYALHALVAGASADPGQARALSAAAGVMAVIALTLFARTLLPWRFALLAGAMAALNAALVDYSQEARAYMLLLLLLAVAARALVGWDAAAREGRRARGWAAAFAVAATLAAYTQLVGTLFLLGEVALAGLFAARRGVRDRATLALLLLPALLVLPELARLLAYAHQNPSIHWLQPAGLAEALFDQAFLLAPAGMMAPDGLPNPDWPLNLVGYGLILLVWVGASLLLRRDALVARVKAAPMAAALVAAHLALPWALFAAGQAGQPLLTIRAALPFLLGALPLLALTASLDVRPRRGLAIAAMLVLLPSAWGLARGAGRHEREDWRAAAAVLRAEARPGDAVIACSAAAYPALAAAVEPGGALPLPVLVAFGRQAVVADRAVGAAGWASRFREPLWRAYDAASEGQVIAASNARWLPVRRLWLASSACPARERAAWQALGPATPRWQSKRTLFHPESGLEVIAVDSPMRVMVPR